MSWNFLEYKNRFVRVLDQESTRTSGVYTPVIFPDQTTPIVVPIKINLDQFTRIFSSLTKGADLTYPFDSMDVQWDFVKAYEEMVEICAEIINCIENNQDTIDAFTKFLIDSGAGSTEKERALKERADQKSDDLLSFSSGGVCDLDALFACVSQMITLLHTNNLDILEIIEVQTNANVELAQVVSSITVLDELSIDTVFNYVAFIQNAIAENYNASYTDELYDQIRCDIFCLAQLECGLSIDILFDYFQEKMSLNSIDVNDITNLVSFFINVIDGSFIGDNVVYFMFYSQLALIKLADSLLTLMLQGNTTFNQANRLNLQIRAFSNDSDPDWEILCTECVTEPLVEIYATNGSPTLTVNSSGVYTLFTQANSFVSIRLIGGMNTCSHPFVMNNIAIATGTPTGIEYQSCPDGTILGGAIPVDTPEGLSISYYAISSTPALGGTDFSITFEIA